MRRDKVNRLRERERTKRVDEEEEEVRRRQRYPFFLFLFPFLSFPSFLKALPFDYYYYFLFAVCRFVLDPGSFLPSSPFPFASIVKSCVVTCTHSNPFFFMTVMPLSLSPVLRDTIESPTHTRYYFVLLLLARRRKESFV